MIFAKVQLLIAVTEDLPNVCVVITDLTATYAGGSQQINEALANLHNESGRVAMDLEPVRMNTDEFYHILRKRIFEKLPVQDQVEEVAQAYAKAVSAARQMDITSTSPEQFAAQVVESYPFHPAIRDLYARFKENQGFQQTRGLIRLMRVLVSHLWESDTDPYMIAPHTLDLNHRETVSEVKLINPTLEAAVSHDIASEGKAVAELMDANLGSTDAQDVAKLLLVSSLANVPGATRGLAQSEIVGYLCEPGRDISHLKSKVLNEFFTAAWYLHTSADGKLFFKDVQNLIAKLNTMANSYLPEQSGKELKERLRGLFTPKQRWCYQDVQTLPAVDDIKVTQDRVTLVIAQYHPDGLHPDLRKYYEQMTYPNRILFLAGQRNFDRVLEVAKQLKAIQKIVDEMKAEKVPENDPQQVQAVELQDRLQGQFLMAVKETFTALHYPTKTSLATTEFIMKYTDNDYNGEEQIIAALSEVQKYTDDVGSDTFQKKIEQRLFTQKSMPWSEITKRAATNPLWQWHHPEALDDFKADRTRKEIWRETGVYVEKGPFPKPDAMVSVQEISRDENTGEVTLRLTPLNADVLYMDVGAEATTASKKLADRLIKTTDLELSFLAIDSSGEHKPTAPIVYHNKITVKSRAYRQGKDMMVELRAAPPAPIRYTTDGSNPKTSGGTYDGPFVVSPGTKIVQAVAEAKNVISDVHKLEIPWDETKSFEVNPLEPAVWHKPIERGNTQGAYGLLSDLKKHEAALSGARVYVTLDDDRWVEANFGDQIELDPARLEQVMDTLRSFLESGVVTLSASRLHFETGQGLLDFAAQAKLSIKPDEVVQ